MLIVNYLTMSVLGICYDKGNLGPNSSRQARNASPFLPWRTRSIASVACLAACLRAV